MADPEHLTSVSSESRQSLESGRSRRSLESLHGGWAKHAWWAVAGALVLVLLTVIFIVQNSAPVTVRFLGLRMHVSLGVALLLSAVAGGLVVLLVSAARMIQIRRRVRHSA